MKIVIEREMGFDREDFIRVIPKGLRHDRFTLVGDTVHVHAPPGRHFNIYLSERPPRRIALLRLPVLQVRFEFDGYRQDEVRALLATFDKYIHRGGG